MKRLAGYCLFGAVAALGLTAAAGPARAQVDSQIYGEPGFIIDPTDNYDTGVRLFDLRVESKLPFLPGPNNLRTIDALRGIGFTDQNIADVINPLIDYKHALAMRTVDEGNLSQAMINNANWMGSPEYSGIESRFRSRADADWQTIADRVGPEKTARLRELCGDTPMVVVTHTAYMDDHLGNIDRLLAQWDQEYSAQQAAMQQQTTVTETQTAVVTPAPAPAPVVEAPAPAPAPQVQTSTTTTQQTTTVTTQQQPVRQRTFRPGRAHRRVRGLG
jgi:hypothetical protein